MHLDKLPDYNFRNESHISEARTMMDNIEKAKKDWVIAQNLLDYVVDKEQIDYAIYALVAAEKKYEMLIKQAKKMKLNLDESGAVKEE